MFGILYSLFMSIGVAGHNIKENFYEDERKNKAKNSYDRTYFDKKGKRILVDNNRWVTSDTVNGDRVLKDVKNGTVYRNFSEEQRKNDREKYKEEAKTSGKTVFFYKRNDKSDVWQGDKYCDIESGEIYVVRGFHTTKKPLEEMYFYVNIENGNLVRKTDFQKTKDQTFVDDLENVYDTVKEYIVSINHSDDITKEELETLIEKEIARKEKIIKGCFLNDEEEMEFISKMNKERESLRNEKPSLYYGHAVVAHN